MTRVTKAFAGESAKVIVEKLLADLDEFAAGAPQEDDITTVLIKRGHG